MLQPRHAHIVQYGLLYYQLSYIYIDCLPSTLFLLVVYMIFDDIRIWSNESSSSEGRDRGDSDLLIGEAACSYGDAVIVTLEVKGADVDVTRVD